jgi:hypothetical protein
MPQTDIKPAAIERPRFDVRLSAVLLTLYALPIAVAARSVLAGVNGRIIGPADGAGDNWWHAWLVWWFRRALARGTDPGHTNMVFGLLPRVATSIDAGFNLVLAWPLQRLVTPIGAYNLAVVLSFVLSGWFMYCLARHFVNHRIGCFVAGFVYSYSLFHFARAEGHFGLATMQWLPFCAWRMFVLVRRPTFPNAVLAGLGVGLVPLSDVYYVPYFLIPFGGLFVIALIVRQPRWFATGRNVACCAVLAAVAVALAAPLTIDVARPDRDVREVGAVYARQSTDTLSADLAAFVLPPPGAPLVGTATKTIYRHMANPSGAEQAVYLGPGLVVLTVCAVVFRRRWDPALVFWLAVGFVGVALALGPHPRIAGKTFLPAGPYRLAFGAGTLAGARAPNRIAVVSLVGFSVVAAMGVSRVAGRLRTARTKRWAGVGLGVLLVAGFVTSSGPALTVHTAPVVTPALYRAIRSDHEPGLLLDLPLLPAGRLQYDQVAHGRRLLGGDVSRITPRMQHAVEQVPYVSLLASGHAGQDPEAEPDIFPVDVPLATALSERNVRYVVLHSEPAAGVDILGNNANASTRASTRAYLEHELGAPMYAARGLLAWRVDGSPPSRLAPLRFTLGPGWFPGLRVTDDGLVRLVENDAEVTVASGTEARVVLTFSAKAVGRPATLRTFVNGVEQRSSTVVPGTAALVETGPILLHGGRNEVRFAIERQCRPPRRVNFVTPDPRCRSVAIGRLRIVDATG